MKAEKNIVFLSIVAGFVVLTIIFLIIIRKDSNGPVITVGGTNITYQKGEDTKKLLEGVTAYDKEDGDVTDSVVIEHMIIVGNGKKLKVTYAAVDKNKNVTKSSKIVNYKDVPKDKVPEKETESESNVNQ